MLLNRSFLFSICVFFMCLSCNQKGANRFRTWEVYMGDQGSTGYSALNQINKNNVDQLEVAWTFKTGDLPDNGWSMMECNPIVVGDVMYVTSPRLKVIALHADTGKEVWRFDPFEGEDRGGLNRGVTYWEDGNDARIFFSAGTWLYALDAKTGEIIPGFGNKGRVSLNEGLGRAPDKISVKSTSPGTVYEDLIIMGSSVGEGYGTPPGYVRAYNVHTGALEWTFHTIPQPGEPGYETWEKDSWKHIGGANVWTGMSLDKEKGIVYLPVGSPNYDYYGGQRKGKNLYANSLVALNAATGEHIWHYQTVHHDIWDYDLPAPPNLVTVNRNGESIDAIAQISKIGFVYFFDRETGEPLFNIKEQTVPASRIPGEKAWPTQPFPEKPKPFIRQHYTRDDIPELFPEARDSVQRLFKKMRNKGLFTPPDTAFTMLLPGSRGGGNWGGPAVDQQTGVIYVAAKESPELAKMQKEKPSKDQPESLFAMGENYYVRNCATCHGIDKKGQPPAFPSLVDIKQKRSEKEMLSIIENGQGRMPGFKDISGKEKQALLAYLFNEKQAVSPEAMMNSEEKSNFDTARYINITAHSYFNVPREYPGIKPPWGTLSAIDLNTGEYLWKIRLGEHEELTQKGIPQTGTENWGGPIVTAGGLVFIAATFDNKFRAFDKDTGELLWETELPTAGMAKPATYAVDGKQYVVIGVGGGRGNKPGDTYTAFALPE